MLTETRPDTPPAEPRGGVSRAPHAHRSGMCNKPTRFELISCPQRLGDIATDWMRLFEEAAGPEQAFLAYDWVMRWAQTYLPRAGTSLAIVAGWRGDALTTLVPFVCSQRLGIRQIGWCGLPVSQYGDVLVGDGNAAQDQIHSALEFALAATRADLVNLRKVRDDARIKPLLDRLGAGASNNERAPFMDLSSAANYDAYRQRYAKRSLKSRRRNRRKLAEHGAIRLRVSWPRRAIAQRAEAVVRAKSDDLRSQSEFFSAVHNPRFAGFFHELFARPADSVEYILSELMVGDMVAAAEIGLLWRGHYMGHVCTFSQRFAKYGPGIILIEELLAYGFDAGWQRIDHLAPASAYKQSLSDDAVGVSDYILPVSMRGRFYAEHVSARVKPLAAGLKTAMRRLPAVSGRR